MKQRNIISQDIQNITSNFKISRSTIEEMYKDDSSIVRNVNQNKNQTSNIGNLTLDSFNSNYYNINNLELVRGYSREAYAFYPVYSTLIDSLSNMFYWRYVFYPRSVKEKANTADYEEVYNNIAEVVDGLSIETTFPGLLTKLFTDGSLFLTTVRRNSSKTITTLMLPPKYCRVTGVTQFGTKIYQFDMSYFDTLGLTEAQLKEIFKMYPDEMQSFYNIYKKDTKQQWHKLNPKFSAAFVLNDNSFPTYLRSLGAIMQYDQYRANELIRNEQQLEKIIAHKMPTWEDKLVVEIPEMTQLHKSMSKVLAKNSRTKMLTTFGDLDVLSIGEDQSKENKTLTNAYGAIFNVGGENENLYSGTIKESLEFSLRRKESEVWQHVQELVAFYNLVINNQFNFKGYQCSLNMLPLSFYNLEKSLLQYKEGATLGVSKIEYIVALGTKQIDIPSKVELETFLKLDELKPLSTSYTGGKNASGMITSKETTPDDNNSNDAKPQEKVEENIKNTEVQNEQIQYSGFR